MAISATGQPFEITPATVVQHPRVLEPSRLVGTEKSTACAPAGSTRRGSTWPRRGWPSAAPWEDRQLDRLGVVLAAEAPPREADDGTGRVSHLQRRAGLPVAAHAFAAFPDSGSSGRGLAGDPGAQVLEFTLEIRVAGFQQTRFSSVSGGPTTVTR